jgi:poly-gamma-glutamate capsule biosynthesis protein CapA/YwtB (metallophosphatase superfamily)
MLKKTLVIGFLFFVVSISTTFAVELKLAFVGDILVARHVGRNIEAYGVHYPFKDVVSILKSADISFGNFESTLYGQKITGSNKQLVFRAPAKFALAVSAGGIDIVSLANNHMLDAGRAGVVSTLDALNHNGILTIGAGRNSSEANAIKIIETKSVKVGFLAFTDIANSGLANAVATSNRAGVATTIDLNRLKSNIASAKKRCDLLIVSFHFGNEYQTNPSVRQQFLAKTALAAGADIIIGHHPHVLQKVVQMKGKTVAYSLGNFVFDNHKPSRARTEILIVSYDSITTRQSIKQIPCYIRNCQPQLLTK